MSLSLIMINLIKNIKALINFVMDPIELDSAYIDLTYLSFLGEGEWMQLISFERYPSFSGIIEFLGFLHVAPNLKEVSVTLNYEEGNPLAHMKQSDVGALELLLNNLECVNISGLQGNNDEVQLVGYILKNATVYVDGAVEDEDARVGKELKFCKACFRLPRSSSTTWVVFSGQYIRATNDTITSRNEI
ncbi:F-box/LRR-repeat protein 13, partial [Bienertia sinuspersici]